MADDQTRRALACFADVFTYPRAPVAAVAEECAALLEPDLPAAAAYMRSFHAAAGELSVPELEEIFTSTFDLDPVCYPYIGYHVFGETYKRSLFLLTLKGRLRACGISIGSELPDHIAPVLRYLAVSDDAEDVEVVTREAMLPALQRMTGRGKSEGHDDEESPAPPPPDTHGVGQQRMYREALEAVRLLLFSMAGVSEDAEIELAQQAHRSLAH